MRTLLRSSFVSVATAALVRVRLGGRDAAGDGGAGHTRTATRLLVLHGERRDADRSSSEGNNKGKDGVKRMMAATQVQATSE